MKKFYYQIGKFTKQHSNNSYRIFCFFFLLCTFYCFNSNSQNLRNLDDFKLGTYQLNTHFKVYQNNLIYQYSGHTNPNLKVYKSSQKNLNISGANKIKDIGLMFYKDRLYTINIDFDGYLSDYQEKTIINDLIKLFGKPDNFVLNPNLKDDSIYEVIKQYEWKSNKSTLLFIKIGSPNYQHNLALYSSEIQSQIILDKFN
jgi:hypothetical protein